MGISIRSQTPPYQHARFPFWKERSSGDLCHPTHMILGVSSTALSNTVEEVDPTNVRALDPKADGMDDWQDDPHPWTAASLFNGVYYYLDPANPEDLP